MNFRMAFVAMATLFSFNVLSAQKLLSPEEFLPHKYGEQFTPHHLVVDYFKHVAANSPNVKFIEYGKTNESRPLIVCIVSSPENMARLESIRAENMARTNGTASVVKNPVAIVWYSMNVHGNEPASSETSMSLLYSMVDPNRADTKNFLKNTVLIIDPCVNPDGYSRYTHWYIGASEKNPDPDAEAREHREPWPGGRVNHYLFDLNRDWAWLTQIESQQRMKLFQQWMPQIVVDYHEMGYKQSYYFAPAAEPFHKFITPFQREMQKTIGKNNAKAFDAHGWLYFTKEEFDLFYPSYGDTYPTYNGGIGMTYEQGGIGAGRLIQLDNGNYLSLKDRIAHHFATGIATLETASQNSAALCTNFEQFYKNNLAGNVGTYKTYIIPNTNNQASLTNFTDLLSKHNIAWGHPKVGKSVLAYNYNTGKEEIQTVKTSDWAISMSQSRATLAGILLNPDNVLSDSSTYDITAWSLPMAFGLNALATKEKFDVETDTFSLRKMALNNTRDSAYAYAINWQSLNDGKLVSALLNRGVKLRVNSAPIQLQGKTLQRGTIIALRNDNVDLGGRFDREIAFNAGINKIDVTPIMSGFSDAGPDLGSGRVELLVRPSVALLQDDDVDNHSYGQLWHFFEQDLNMNVMQIKLSDFNRFKWSRFNVLCLTDGNYANLDAGKIERIKQWVNEGGRLILIGDALHPFEDKKGFELTKFASKKDKDAAEESENQNNLKKRFMHYDEFERDGLSDNNPGSIVSVKLDNSNPLAYGMTESYFSLKTSSDVYQPLKNCYNVGILNANGPSAGFVGARAKSALAGSMVFAVQNARSGSIIYMVDNPVYRAFWYNGKFLMCNALFMPMK